MQSYGERAAENASKGLCTRCGKPLDLPGKFVMCKHCRDMKRQSYARGAKEAALWRLQKACRDILDAQECRIVQYCEHCPFCTYTGSRTWYCPLPVCYYLRDHTKSDNPLGTTITEISAEASNC